MKPLSGSSSFFLFTHRRTPRRVPRLTHFDGVCRGNWQLAQVKRLLRVVFGIR